MKLFRWEAASSLGRPENGSFMTRFSKAALISQDSESVRGAIGVLRKSLLLVLVKSHNLVLSWAIVTNKQTNTRAHKKQAKKRRTRKEKENGKRGRIKWQGWSGGEENERQMANNEMRGIRVCDGYLVCLDLCVDLPGNGARNTSCYLLSMHWFSLAEERVMQQSSVSISLSFWEPRYQSSRRLHASPSYLHKQIRTLQPTR